MENGLCKSETMLEFTKKPDHRITLNEWPINLVRVHKMFNELHIDNTQTVKLTTYKLSKSTRKYKRTKQELLKVHSKLNERHINSPQ